ncbi:MAG TPA: glutaredoxin family protein [Rhodocyclaceae bacterium]|nr:glutaredoxin family protein [Rhodocyclaceae bacterium]
MSARPRLTLYGRAGCHLCERMRAALAPLEAELGFEVHEVDIGGDPALCARYGELIPVLAADGRELCHFVLDAAAVRAQFVQIR